MTLKRGAKLGLGLGLGLGIPASIGLGLGLGFGLRLGRGRRAHPIMRGAATLGKLVDARVLWFGWAEPHVFN